jgi:hypothetical protein
MTHHDDAIAERDERIARLIEAAKRLSIVAEGVWVGMSEGERLLLRDAWAALDAAIANAEVKP